MRNISPSIIAADFTKLEKEIKIVEDLGMNVSRVGEVIYISIIFSLIGPLFVGLVGNRLGRKIPILVCLFLSSFCIYFIFGVATVETFYYGNITWNIIFTIMVIFPTIFPWIDSI